MIISTTLFCDPFLNIYDKGRCEEIKCWFIRAYNSVTLFMRLCGLKSNITFKLKQKVFIPNIIFYWLFFYFRSYEALKINYANLFFSFLRVTLHKMTHHFCSLKNLYICLICFFQNQFIAFLTTLYLTYLNADST